MSAELRRGLIAALVLLNLSILATWWMRRPPPRIEQGESLKAEARVREPPLLPEPDFARPLPIPTPPAPAERPDIVLVVVDTVRADHLGLHGYARDTMPALSALAAEGAWWSQAYAQSGWTLGSMASLLTGTWPHSHRVGRDPRRQAEVGALVGEFATLPEALQRAGYSTAAWVNNTFLAPAFGVHQGFTTYDYCGANNEHHRSSKATAQKALAWLQAQDRPAFAMVHFMDPHMDYVPPPSVHGLFAQGDPPPELGLKPDLSFATTTNTFAQITVGQIKLSPEGLKYLVALYDEELRAADQGLGLLIEGLKARPRWENTIVVVTSDHGESFLEHGRFEHGHGLWGELTHVPLVARGPGLPRGEIRSLVEHVDLFQALIRAGGAPRPQNSVGEDLFALAAKGSHVAGRMSLQENCLYGAPCISMVSESHRLIIDPVAEMAESWFVDRPGAETRRAEGEDHKASLEALLPELMRRRGSVAPLNVRNPQQIDYDTFLKLKDLGYMEGSEVEGTSTAAPCALE